MRVTSRVVEGVRGRGGEGQGNRPNGRSERNARNEAGSGNDQERQHLMREKPVSLFGWTVSERSLFLLRTTSGGKTG